MSWAQQLSPRSKLAHSAGMLLLAGENLDQNAQRIIQLVNTAFANMGPANKERSLSRLKYQHLGVVWAHPIFIVP